MVSFFKCHPIDVPIERKYATVEKNVQSAVDNNIPLLHHANVFSRMEPDAQQVGGGMAITWINLELTNPSRQYLPASVTIGDEKGLCGVEICRVLLLCDEPAFPMTGLASVGCSLIGWLN